MGIEYVVVNQPSNWEDNKWCVIIGFSNRKEAVQHYKAFWEDYEFDK